MTAPTATLINTHHHFFPPTYQKAWLQWEQARKVPDFPSQVSWSKAGRSQMDQAGIRTAVLSIASTPGVWFDLDAEKANQMARDCNDYAAEWMCEKPGRFGLFATLSMIDIDRTLNEIEYAFDTREPRAPTLKHRFYVGSASAARRRKMLNCTTTVAQWSRVEIST